MGVSTDGQICYGIVLSDDYELPWDAERCEGDWEEWWLDVKGFDKGFYPFDAEGAYKEGVTENDPRIGEYFTRQRTFFKENPLPFEMVNYCSGDYPMYVLAVPGTCIRCCRGHPEVLDIKNLIVADKDCKNLLEFCKEHNIKGETPSWLLTSYWG